MATERGSYRFTVKETDRGTFFLAAEPAADTLKGLNGLLGLHLEAGTTLEEAISLARLMNSKGRGSDADKISADRSPGG